MEDQGKNKEQQEIKIQVPSTDNIASRRSLIPSLFALVVVFFFFNFFTISCGGQKVKSVTGVNLITGTEIKGPQMYPGQKSKGEEIPSNAWAIIALGSAIVGLGAFLIKGKNEAVIGAGAGAIGVGSLLILQVVIKNELERKANGMSSIQADFQFAYWGALIAFILAGFISYLRITKKHVVTATISSPTATTTTENISQATVSATPQNNNFNSGKGVNKNKKVLAILFSVGIILFGGYQLFCFLSPKEINIEQTQLRDGLRYEVNSDKPFSGIIYQLEDVSLQDEVSPNSKNIDKDYKPGYKYYYTFRDGKMDGKFKEFYTDGALKQEGIVRDNKPEGEWKSYYYNGQLKSISNYKNGLTEGIVTNYYKNGALWAKLLYKEGKLWESLVDNLPDGTPDGSNVKNGNGFMIIQNDEGDSVSKDTYVNGVKVWSESYTPESNKVEYALDYLAVDTTAAVIADTGYLDEGC